MRTVEYQPCSGLPQLPLVTAVQALDLEENYGSVEGIHFWVMPSTEPLNAPYQIEDEHAFLVTKAQAFDIDSWMPEGLDKHNEAYIFWNVALEDIFEEQRRIIQEEVDHAFLCGPGCDGNPHKIDSWKPEGLANTSAIKKVRRRPNIAYLRETVARRLYEYISGSDFPDE
jgi:hypothetical protein